MLFILCITGCLICIAIILHINLLLSWWFCSICQVIILNNLRDCRLFLFAWSLPLIWNCHRCRYRSVYDITNRCDLELINQSALLINVDSYLLIPLIDYCGFHTFSLLFWGILLLIYIAYLQKVWLKWAITPSLYNALG